MKARIKFFAVVMVSVLCVMLLTSCNLIDELREKRVVALDEDIEVIEYKGTKYKRLPYFSTYQIDVDTRENGYIVESDVPLLLIDSFGLLCHFDNELGIIRRGDMFYSKLSEYEKYSNMLNEGKLDSYKFEQYFYNPDNGFSEQVDTILDPEVVEIINETVKYTEGYTREENDYSWEFIGLKKCSADGILESVEDSFDLFRDPKNNKICGLVIYDHYQSSGVLIKNFNEEDVEIINKIFDEYNENINKYYTYRTNYYYVVD